MGMPFFFANKSANRLLQCLCQLIRAGGGFAAAGGAFQTRDNLCNVHTFDQRADALEVAVATADELNVLHLAVLNVKENALRASAKSLVFKHGVVPFRIFWCYYIVIYEKLQE